MSLAAVEPPPQAPATGNVVSLAEWRARRHPGEHPDPAPTGGGRPALRLVRPGDAAGELRLEVFLARAALVLAGE